MKTDTKLKTAKILVAACAGGFRIIAATPDGEWLANLIAIKRGRMRAVPGARALLIDQGYTLPGAKWGKKGQILVQTD